MLSHSTVFARLVRSSDDVANEGRKIDTGLPPPCFVGEANALADAQITLLADIMMFRENCSQLLCCQSNDDNGFFFKIPPLRDHYRSKEHQQLIY